MSTPAPPDLRKGVFVKRDGKWVAIRSQAALAPYPNWVFIVVNVPGGGRVIAEAARASFEKYG